MTTSPSMPLTSMLGQLKSGLAFFVMELWFSRVPNQPNLRRPTHPGLRRRSGLEVVTCPVCKRVQHAHPEGIQSTADTNEFHPKRHESRSKRTERCPRLIYYSRLVRSPDRQLPDPSYPCELAVGEEPGFLQKPSST